jgi:large subunit ribosomal protein L21
MAKEDTKKATPAKTATKAVSKGSAPAVKKAPKAPRAPKAQPDSFSIILTGGKQYKVASGDTIKIEKIKDLKTGDKVVFDQVLMSYDGSAVKVGTPSVAGIKVEGEVVEEGRSKKVVVVKYKQKSRYFKNRGHRQPFMKVLIK